MPHDLTGKVWAIDSGTAFITSSPVCIHGVKVRFTTAGAGSCLIVTNITTEESTVGKPFFNAKTVSTATSNAFELTQFCTYGNQTFHGLRLALAVNVDTIQIITCNPD